MNGVPEAIGTGVSKLVDINPAIGILVAALFVVIAVLWKWGLDGWKAARDAKQAHLEYVEGQLAEARKDLEMYDRVIQDRQPARRRAQN